MTRFEIEYNNQLTSNIANLRSHIMGPGLVKKIMRYAKKFSLRPTLVRKKILNDDIFANQFAKDPSRQNFYRKIAESLIKEILNVDGLKMLPLKGNSAWYLESGALYPQKTEGCSRLDFVWEYDGKLCYAKHVFTRGSGGAQYNQYQKMRQFIKNCHGNEEIHFFALCDGNFYTDKRLQELQLLVGDSTVIVCHTEDISKMFS